jgi:hypothetical protein
MFEKRNFRFYTDNALGFLIFKGFTVSHNVPNRILDVAFKQEINFDTTIEIYVIKIHIAE